MEDLASDVYHPRGIKVRLDDGQIGGVHENPAGLAISKAGRQYLLPSDSALPAVVLLIGERLQA